MDQGVVYTNTIEAVQWTDCEAIVVQHQCFNVRKIPPQRLARHIQIPSQRVVPDAEDLTPGVWRAWYY